MRHLAAIFLVVTLIAAANPAPSARPANPYRGEPCSSYKPHMKAAHDDLVRGDRSRAIEDLEVARAALESCRRLHTGSRAAIASAD
jgi:hypothetical protein